MPSVHDLHVWTLATGVVAWSCHVVAAGSERGVQQVVRAVAEPLKRGIGAAHTTVQVESGGCVPVEVDGTRVPAAGHEAGLPS